MDVTATHRGRHLPPLLLCLMAAPAAAQTDYDALSDREFYRAACANCHGADGTGMPAAHVGFEEALPDFTDCNFATREPDADWIAVAHQGGPARGFSTMMPAFGEALTPDQLRRVVSYVRTFCSDTWPRGELNFPRALVTEKAYPEDEAVFSTATSLEGSGSVMNELVYEGRFGTRNQFEVVVPFGWQETTSEGGRTAWDGGVGDVVLGLKRDVWHSFETGSIVSLAGEVKLPTGSETHGFGGGVTVFESFLSWGQALPRDAFLQLQAILEVPARRSAAEEALWRVALGKTVTRGPHGFGRAWSPMVELLGWRELAAGEEAHWDILPQLQVTLNTRQHVMANLGVRLPLDDAGVRDAQLLVYVLWDWFDGGFFEAW